MTHLNRRRFLTISAAFGLTGGAAQAGGVMRWRGRALGANASMILTGLSEAQAEPIFRTVQQELTRLEAIFSLYINNSEIVRLNATGRLENPSSEMLEVLSLSASLYHATDGAFDPSVQPLWLALAQGGDPDKAQALVGWENVRFDTGAVRLLRPGMGLTLNGIAQGYISDQIAGVLRGYRVENMLIDMGEIVAIGAKPGGRNWQAAIAHPDGRIVHHVTLGDRALATSAPYGTTLSAQIKLGHIIDPKARSKGPKQTLVSVSARSAAVADGLSTACCLLDADKARSVVTEFDGAELEYIT
ncbi:MAG: FAD:protein FMN transferase [Rhodobacteraceae bacterium]|nr:FAD:protein FMN transferase [Paracoccaceae bacterium]